MRIKRIIPGLNNSQRFRVILNGVGFMTTVEDMTNMPFRNQRVVVWQAMAVIAREKIQGYGTTTSVYNDSMQKESFDVQVDLV